MTATKSPYQRLLDVGFAPTGKFVGKKPVLIKGTELIVFYARSHWIKTAAGAIIKFKSPAFENFLERKKGVVK